MIELSDDKNYLFWKKYEDGAKENFDIVFEIDSWSANANIRRYITEETSLHDFLLYTKENNTCNSVYDGLFYCFEEEKLVGVYLISQSLDSPNSSDISYLIVNPKMHDRGIGTRMISSIRENSEFFTNRYNTKKIYATVCESNIPSMKAFLKNKFDVVSCADMKRFNGFAKLYTSVNFNKFEF